jgi:CHAT domain-containing protein
MKKAPIISILILSLCFGSHIILASDPGLTYFERANHYFETLRFDSAEVYFSKAAPFLKNGSKIETYGNALNNHAASLWWQSKFFEAELACRNNLETLIEIFGYRHPITADAMVNLGALGFASGNFGMTPEYLRQAINIYEKNFGSEHPKVATAYEWLGAWYEARADTLKARKYLWKAFHLWSACKGEDHPDLGNIYRYMGLYHKRFQNPDSALIYFKKAKELFDRKYGPANFQSVKCLNNMASVFSENPELNQEVTHIYDQCFELIHRFPSTMLMAEVMTLFNNAAFMGSKGDYISAIETMNQVLTLYYPSFRSEGIFSNPDLSNAETNKYVKFVLFFKTLYFRSLFRESNPPEMKYLDATLECFRIFDMVTNQIIKRMINLDDLLKMETNAAEVNYEMVATAVEAYQLSKDTSYITTAINFINHKQFNPFLPNPEITILQQFDLNGNLQEQRKTLIESINQLKTNMALNQCEDSLKNTLFLLNKDIIALDRLYFAHFKENWIASRGVEPSPLLHISEVQAKLRPDESLLLFLERKPLHQFLPQELLIIAVTDHRVQTEIIKDENLFVQLYSFYDSIAAQKTSNLKNQGSRFYSMLIEPFEGLLQKNLIIFPSPVLSHLPFDMLVVPSEGGIVPQEFLISRHTIRKEFSLLSFYQNRKKNQARRTPRVLAVAPKFNENQKIQLAELTKRDTSLINLTGALVECRNISNFFRTKLLTGFSATRQQFLDTYQDYNVIHLSTHGVPLKNEPAMMQLAFSASPGSGSDHMMSFYEVLNLQLNTELVVLSACKTGFGKINHGTGSLSLNWAFNKAGARSSVISLWDVNDYASAMIISDFYRNLAQGISKPEALRLAKLEYINSHDELMSDPYYWAGFIYYGPDDALVNSAGHSRTGIIILIIGMLVAAAIALLYKRFSS